MQPIALVGGLGLELRCRLRHKLRWKGFRENGIERGAQRSVLRAPGLHAARIFRMRGEVPFNFGAPLGGQQAVHVGMQIGFIYRVHLITFRGVPCGCPSIKSLSFSRPRDRRDITVPTGMPSVVATSS